MLLKELMTDAVEATSKTSTVAEAAGQMRASDIGFLPVIEGTELVGVLTDRDIAIRGVIPGRDPDSIPVEEIMTRDVHTVQQDADSADAIRRMQDQQIQRLLVVDSDGHYAGVVSLGDLARQCDDAPSVGQTMEKIAAPA